MKKGQEEKKSKKYQRFSSIIASSMPFRICYFEQTVYEVEPDKANPGT